MVGLINVQYAIFDGEIYILEVNPRASRTIPVRQQGDRRSAGQARRAGDGRQEARRARLYDRARAEPRRGQGIGVPVRAFSGRRYYSRSGNEIDRRGDGNRHHVRDGVSPRRNSRRLSDLPLDGLVFISVRDDDKPQLGPIARGLADDGLRLVATGGTARFIHTLGYRCETVNKVARRESAHCRCDARGKDRDGDQHARRDRHRRFVFDSAHRARNAAAVISPRWRGRRPRSKESRRSNPNHSKSAPCRTITAVRMPRTRALKADARITSR